MRRTRWDDVVGRPRWEWATVSATAPLLVQMPGTTTGVAVIGCAVPDLSVGDKVRVRIAGRAVEIVYRHHTY